LGIRAGVWIGLLALALGIGSITIGAAEAATIDLTNADINLPGLNVAVQVAPETCGTNQTCLMVQYLSSNLANTPLELSQISYSPEFLGLTAPIVVSSDPPAWLRSGLCPLSGCPAGGFGNFDIGFTGFGAFLNSDLTVTLTLASQATGYVPNDAIHKAEFAVGLVFTNPDCAFFVSDGTASPVSPAGACSLSGPGGTVPEPAAVILMGTAFLGLFGLRRPLPT
jgi:hypothetical protein